MKQSIHQHAKVRPTHKRVNRNPSAAAAGAGLPAIQRTPAFNPARARNRTTPSPLRGEGRGEGAILPTPARMTDRTVSGDNT